MSSLFFNVLRINLVSPSKLTCSCRSVHITPCCFKNVSGKYKRTLNKTRPLTYEMRKPPPEIGHSKAWNSWNTSNLVGGLRKAETTVDDAFIRRFMVGTWHGLFVSQILIKRQHNMIRIGGIIHPNMQVQKIYFLIGYTEEFLTHWLQCPCKLELQCVDEKEKVIVEYI